MSNVPKNKEIHSDNSAINQVEYVIPAYLGHYERMLMEYWNEEKDPKTIKSAPHPPT